MAPIPSITSLSIKDPAIQEAPALPISPVIVSTATIENVSCASTLNCNDKNRSENNQDDLLIQLFHKILLIIFIDIICLSQNNNFNNTLYSP